MRLLRHFPASAFKFAVFALVCLVLLVGLAVRIGNISLFTSRHTIDAQLTDVTGLASGDTVNIAGVPVGQVASIGIQRGHAVIGMSINNTVTLRRSTDVGMRWHNVIGQKEVELYPGHDGPILPPGATIPLTHDVTDASIDTFLNSLGPVLSSINPTEANAFVENVSGALEGDTAQINQLINSGASVSSTVQALDTQVGQVIGNLDQVLTALASRSGDIDSLVTNLQTVSSSLASKNTLLDGVVGNLSQVATDLAGLIGDNHNTITSTIDNLQAVAADVQNNQQNLANSLSTLGAGLAPYIQISQWGQWFAVETIYTCLANQTVCPYYQPGNPPAGSGPFGSPPLPAPALGPHHAGTAQPRRALVGLVAAAPNSRRPAGRGLAGRIEPGPRPAGRGGRPREAPSEGLHRAEPQGRRRHGGRSDGRLHPGHPLPQPEPVQLGLHHRRPLPQRGRHLQGHRGHGGRRQRGDGDPVTVHGNAVDAQLSVNNSVVLPHVTTAAVEVETLLGVVDVTLKPVSGWADPLKRGALITNTSVPTEFYQLQNTAHSLLSKTNAQALNNLVTSLADITKDKQTQVAQIIAGLGALTTTVDQRSGQVSSLIDSANTLSSALAARDQQLLSVVDNLDTVSTGLAAHDQDLSNLITNVDALASQTNSLVNHDSPALDSLLQSLHADLGVVGQHQLDLAQGVSYLGGALKGFQSIAYSGSTPVNWGNIFVNPASLTNTFGIIGPCGALDQVLNQVLGPDPASCNAQTGPLPGEGSIPEPAASPPAGSAAPASSQPSSSAGATTTTTPSSAAAGGLRAPTRGWAACRS